MKYKNPDMGKYTDVSKKYHRRKMMQAEISLHLEKNYQKASKEDEKSIVAIGSTLSGLSSFGSYKATLLKWGREVSIIKAKVLRKIMGDWEMVSRSTEIYSEHLYKSEALSFLDSDPIVDMNVEQYTLDKIWKLFAEEKDNLIVQCDQDWFHRGRVVSSCEATKMMRDRSKIKYHVSVERGSSGNPGIAPAAYFYKVVDLPDHSIPIKEIKTLRPWSGLLDIDKWKDILF